MQIEQHPDGVTLNRPAVVIRGARLTLGGTGQFAPQRAESQVCPKCGQSGYNCCSYADRTELSSEGQGLYRNLIERDAASTERAPFEPVPSQPQAEQTQADSGTVQPSSSEEGLTDRAVAPSEEKHAAGDNDDEHSSGQGDASSDSELSEEEKQEVNDLQQRDQEVRQHEQAHASAAGHLAVGGPSFSFETGPDGKRYATEGDVKIAVGSGDTPQERASNARQAQRAALAPAEPSDQDRKVAAEAARVAAEAEREASQQRAEENGQSSPLQPSSTDASDKPESGEVGLKQSGDDTDSDSPLAKSARATSPLEKAVSDSDGKGLVPEQAEGALKRAANAYSQQSYSTPQLARSLDIGTYIGGQVRTSA